MQRTYYKSSTYKTAVWMLSWCGQQKNQHTKRQTTSISCFIIKKNLYACKNVVVGILVLLPMILVACFQLTAATHFVSKCNVSVLNELTRTQSNVRKRKKNGKNNHLKNLQNCRELLNFLWIRSCIFVIIAIYSFSFFGSRMKTK